MASRRERAAQTRRRMLDAAFDLFADRGFQGTTVAAVAERAEVSEQTVYFTFHTKAELLWEVVTARRTGDDENREIMTMQWVGEAFAEPDARRTVALIAEHATGIFERLAPIADAMNAAAAVEVDIAEQLEATQRERRQGMTAMMTALADKATLAAPLGRAVDIVDVVESLGTYRAFTMGCGWSNEEFKAWAYRCLSQLLEPLTPARARALDLAATRDLSYHSIIADDLARPAPIAPGGGP